MYLRTHIKNESFGLSQDTAISCTAVKGLILELQLRYQLALVFASGSEWFFSVQRPLSAITVFFDTG
jgi:hypothetical protein